MVRFAQTVGPEMTMPNLESNTQHDLGSVIARHRVSKSVSNYIPSGTVFFLLAFGVIVLLTSKDILSLFTCVLPPALAFGVLVWNLITGRSDELTVTRPGVGVCR